MITLAQMEKNLTSFFHNRSPKINARVVNRGRGPIVDFFDLKLGPRDTFNKINRLAVDIGIELRSCSAPIIYPVPQDGLVRIEVPRPNRPIIQFRADLASTPLKMHLGTSCTNSNVVLDLRDCPHLLIAGSTQSGKSVMEHNIIMSLLGQRDSVQLFLIDPKQVEFTIYKHVTQVCTALPEANRLLRSLLGEMTTRLGILESCQVRNIDEYNAISTERMKYVVVVIDELADLISDSIFETSLSELAQKSRSVGIHLVVATQRPSVDIINGVIKANFPVRIALRVPTKTDSRVILDAHGAENLIGKGDALLMSQGSESMLRFQGAFQSVNSIKMLLRDMPQMVVASDGVQSYGGSFYAASAKTIAKEIMKDFTLGGIYRRGKPVDISRFSEFKRWRQSGLPIDEFRTIILKLEEMGFLEKSTPLNNVGVLPFLQHTYILHPDAI